MHVGGEARDGANVREAGPLGVFIRRRREEFGWTIRELAERMGSDVEPNYITQVETGRIQLPRKYLTAFASALDVPEDALWRIAGVLGDAPAEAISDPGEAAMLLTWRELNDINRQVLTEMARTLERSQEAAAKMAREERDERQSTRGRGQNR